MNRLTALIILSALSVLPVQADDLCYFIRYDQSMEEFWSGDFTQPVKEETIIGCRTRKMAKEMKERTEEENPAARLKILPSYKLPKGFTWLRVEFKE